MLEAPSDRFDELVKATGLYPKCDLRYGDWRGFDFTGNDLRGFDFTGADLTGARFDNALIAETIFDKAIYDAASLSRAVLGRRKGAVDFQSTVVRRPYFPLHFTATDDQELAEIKRPLSIDELIARVRADEEKIFLHARERAIDPLALRSRLLLNLPRLVTADGLPGKRDIQQEIRAVSDFLEASSHKAAQWREFAYEEGTRYMYLNGRYRTMRFFVENYGVSDPDQLKEKLGNSFEVSIIDLRPMLILAIPLRRRARKAIPMKPYLFERPALF